MMFPSPASPRVCSSSPWFVFVNSGGSVRDSSRQAVQGVEAQENISFALECACSIPEQLARLQVRGDVFHTYSLWEEKYIQYYKKKLNII